MNADDIYMALGDVETNIIDLAAELQDTDPREWVGLDDSMQEVGEFLAEAATSVSLALGHMKQTVHRLAPDAA